MTRLRLALCLSCTLTLAGCGGVQPSEPTAPSPTPPTQGEVPAKPAEGAGAGAPATAELAWMLGQLEPGAALDVDDYRARFHPEFVEAVPPDQFSSLTTRFAGFGPWQTGCVVEQSAEKLRIYLTPTDDGTAPLLLSMVVDRSAAEPIITGLHLGPAPYYWRDDEQAERAPDWATLDAELAALADVVSLLVAEVDEHGELEVVHARMPDLQMAVASGYKLWVLAALAEAVAAGERSWEDTLGVDDALRSLSSARLDKVEAGTELTLREWALPMISVSDNTAADRLLLELGRPAVETAMRNAGHAEPERNAPILTTRDMFWLKMQATDAQRQRFLDGDEATRRALLDTESNLEVGPAYWAAMGWTTPRDIDTIEWFASVNDQARSMLYLDTLAGAEGGEPIDTILSTNPGLHMCQPWTRIWFKGGSEGGVYHSTWLLERADGRRFVMAMTLNDTETLIPDGKVVPLAFAATRLLGAHP